MAAHAFAKEDIEILTNNILNNRASIIQKLYDEHIEIDPNLLYSNYRSQLQPSKNENTSATEQAQIDDDPLRFDDFQQIYNEMDEIDKKLPDLPKTQEFKEPKGLRRYNSKHDIVDKTMMSSMTNLTMIKRATAPMAAPLPPPPPPPPELEPSIELTTEQLIEFNALKQHLKSQLDACKLNNCDDDPFGLADTGRKISDSFDRLQMFFDEIIPLAAMNGIRTEIKTEADDRPSVWNTLDTQWIQSLRKLSEVKLTT